MKIDYKKELEGAAKTMILIHEPDSLIKMIVRMMVQKVRVSHAGLLLHDREKETYVLTVSRGTSGKKIPAGFARMDLDNPLIRFFREHIDKQIFNDGALIYEEGKQALKKKKLSSSQKKILEKSLTQMEIFETQASIPSYFRDELLAILMLGRKQNGKKFGRDELNFFVALASDVAMAIRNAQLFKELALELDRKQRLFIHTTIALAAAIEAKDAYTHGHTERVRNISKEIGKKLMLKHKAEFNEKFLENLEIASLLHDIGKIGTPESILNKTEALTEEERKKINEHPLIGEAILFPIRELKECVSGIRYHHERYDGRGYPEGLSGASIPLIASIISVADSFDAMTKDRPYRKGLSKEEAIEEIKRERGKQFDPRIADTLIEIYQEGKI